jgi:hypothetical protein
VAVIQRAGYGRAGCRPEALQAHKQQHAGAVN